MKTSSNVSKSIQRTFNLFLLLDLKFPIFLYAFILLSSSVLLTGYRVYYENQCLQIPLVFSLNNPSLYPNDPFAATLPYYASMLWKVVALGVRVIPLQPLLLTLFLLTRLLVIYTAGNLARTFAPNSKLAVVGAMALFALPIEPILGSGTIVLPYFEQTSLSIAFFLLAIASFYNSRPILWAIWLAIGFNLNSLYGIYALTYFGAVFLLDSTYRRAWKKWFLCFGLFLIIAFPVILFTLSAFGRNATNDQLWLVASQVRFPHHLYPLTWGKQEFSKFIVLIVLVIALLHQNRHRMQKLFKHGVIWAGISVLWLLYAFVAAYIAKSPSMLVMHPGRGTDLWYCFAGIALVSTCAVNVEQSKGRLRQAILVAAFGSTILLWRPIIDPYILAVCLIALILQPVWYYILCKGSSSRLALLLTLGLLLVGALNFYSRLVDTKSLKDAFILEPPSAVEQIADWARTKATIDAVFLVDPRWDYFRALAERPVFVTWKDGSAILWDRTFVKAWTERLMALGLDINQQGLDELKAINKLGSLYEKLDDEDIKQLQSRFPMRYWVVPTKHPSSFPVAFQNSSYKVVELKSIR